MSIQVSTDGDVATLTLDDPTRKNAMSEAMADAFQAGVESLRATSIRAVIITGSGTAFSGGGDLSMLQRLTTLSAAEAERFMLDYYQRFLCVRELSVPVVAAVNGAAVGAGLCLALACDMMIVATDAKLALNFVRLGLHPGMGATHYAPLRFGAPRAMELLCTGRFFSGEDALAWGGALEAPGASQVLARATAIAHEIASSGPVSTRALTASLRAADAGLPAALAREAVAQAASYGSAELQVGLLAAREKRAAQF